MNVGGKTQLGTRVLWAFHFGEVPEGYAINHSCGESRCLNYAHLRLRPHGSLTKDNLHHWLRIRSVETVDGHWLWQFGTQDGSKPMVRHGSRMRNVRVLVWGMLNDEEVPANMWIQPGCGHLLCVKPDHQIKRSQSEALIRPKGEDHWSWKPERWKVSTEHFLDGEPCWDWLLAAKYSGSEYGRNSGGYHAHRSVYKQLVDPDITPDIVLHHKCFRPICVNPSHLEPLTVAEHVALHRELRRAGAPA